MASQVTTRCVSHFLGKKIRCKSLFLSTIHRCIKWNLKNTNELEIKVKYLTAKQLKYLSGLNSSSRYPLYLKSTFYWLNFLKKLLAMPLGMDYLTVYLLCYVVFCWFESRTPAPNKTQHFHDSSSLAVTQPDHG